MIGPGEREVEVKRLLVPGGAVESLIAALGGAISRQRLQINHVLHTDHWHLGRARYALRLREEPGTAFLTIGASGSVAARTVSRTEAEIEVDPKLVDDIVAGRIDAAAVLRSGLGREGYEDLGRGLEMARAGRPVRSVGHFENERSVVPATLRAAGIASSPSAPKIARLYASLQDRLP